MPDEVLTINAEVAALLKLAEKSVYAELQQRSDLLMAQAGEIPAFKIRGQWRIKRADLDRWIDVQPRGGEGERDGQ